jgi:hypothetical protein
MHVGGARGHAFAIIVVRHVVDHVGVLGGHALDVPQRHCRAQEIAPFSVRRGGEVELKQSFCDAAVQECKAGQAAQPRTTSTAGAVGLAAHCRAAAAPHQQQQKSGKAHNDHLQAHT